MQVLAIASQRGNVGKTSTACALSLGLRENGYRVLSIDLDPQADLSHMYGIDADAEGISSTQDVISGAELSDVIVPTMLGDVAPAGIGLSCADMQMMTLGAERILSDTLVQVAGSYDYAVIDTPPNLGILAWNALYACTAALVVTSPGAYRANDFPLLSQTFSTIRRSFNPSFKVMGAVLTRVSASRENEEELVGSIEKAAHEANFTLMGTRVREGCGTRVASEMANQFNGTVRLPRDYADLTQEVIRYFDALSKKRMLR